MKKSRPYLLPVLLLLIFVTKIVIAQMAGGQFAGKTAMESKAALPGEQELADAVTADADDFISSHPVVYAGFTSRCFVGHGTTGFLPAQYFSIPTPPPWL